MSVKQDNLNVLCRLCLSDDGKVPIFPGENNKDDLCEKIFQCVDIQVKNDGKLPDKICSVCITSIDSWAAFKAKCHKSQDTLRSMVEVRAPLVDGTFAKEMDTIVNGDIDAVTQNGETVAEKDAVEERLESPISLLADGVTNGATPSKGVSLAADEEKSNLDREDGSEPSNTREAVVGGQTEPSVEGESSPANVASEGEEDFEDFEEDLAEYDEPPTAQLINPKFAAKRMNIKAEMTPKPLLEVALTSQNLKKADSTETAQILPLTVDLSLDEDDDVAVIEPVIEKINLDDEHISSTVNQQESQNEGKKDPEPKDETIQIQSAVTLPAPGGLFEKDASKQDQPLTGETEETVVPVPSETSRDNSPDRTSLHESMMEDDQFEDDDGSTSLPTLGDSRTTPDSTMLNSNADDQEVSVDFGIVKEERNRGYADEEDLSQSSFASQVPGNLSGKAKEEFERSLLANDKTVDATLDRCIICEHTFSSITSLLRHTKSKTHILNKAIVKKQESGIAPDPVALAIHQRKMLSYRNQWRISGKKRPAFSLDVIRTPPANPGKRYCKMCSVGAASERDWERHKQSKRHKLGVMMGGIPPDPKLTEEAVTAGVLDEKKPQRTIIRPQPLQYNHSDPPQHKTGPSKALKGREFMCPIPNCGYVCYEGAILLTHMTSHGIQGAPALATPQPQAAKPQTPLQMQPQASSTPQDIYAPGSPSRTSKYENLFCNYHNIYFETARGYLNHIRFCPMAPPIRTFLKKEFQNGSESSDRYCKMCDLSFSSPEMYVQHMGVYHKGSSVQQEAKPRIAAPTFVPKMMPQSRSNLKNKCHLCGKVFNLLHSLNMHIRAHHHHQGGTGQGNVCKVCKKSFLTRKSCASHMKNHFLPPGTGKLWCSSCYKTFETRGEISRHRYDGTCTPQGTQPGDGFPCNQCQESFKDLIALNDHIEKSHPEIKQEKQDEEERGEEEEGEEEDSQEYQPAELVQPILAPEPLPPPPPRPAPAPAPAPQVLYEADEMIKCMLCGKKFSNMQNLKRHCRFIHRMQEGSILKMIRAFTTTNKRPTKNVSNPAQGECGGCGMPSDGQGCANCNARPKPADVSEGGLLFKCPIGHMSFNDEDTMIKHYSYCTGSCGPYFHCGNCGCEFKYRKNFDIHNCALSKKKITYDCSECHRSFSKKSYLINHELKCPNVLNASGSGSVAQHPSTSQQDANSDAVKKTRQRGGADGEVEETVAAPEGDPVPPEVFACPECDKIFYSQKALNGHGRVHSGVIPKNPMFCKFCGKEDISFTSLYGHVYKCVRSLLLTEEVLTCEDCTTFLSRYDTPKELSTKLHTHVLNCYPIPWFKGEGEGEGGDKLLCYVCCHAFSSVESLTIHKSQHKKLKAKRGSPFLKTSAKKRPRFQGHRAPKPLDFDPNDMIEEEVFESEDSTTLSITSHSSATQFILNCQVCNRQFNNIDKLRNHEKVHGIVRQVVSGEEGGGT